MQQLLALCTSCVHQFPLLSWEGTKPAELGPEPALSWSEQRGGHSFRPPRLYLPLLQKCKKYGGVVRMSSRAQFWDTIVLSNTSRNPCVAVDPSSNQDSGLMVLGCPSPRVHRVVKSITELVWGAPQAQEPGYPWEAFRAYARCHREHAIGPGTW